MDNLSKVYDGLRKAVAALNIQEEGQARNALVQVHAISWNDAIEISSAMAALRSIFQKLDDWERRQQNRTPPTST